ncbi:unnamed protein product [Rhizophagus irregularis]|nr:unnamed protein product [Rhizophagus irregularis]
MAQYRPHGQLKPCGVRVLRALRVLGGEGSGGDKKVNSDENTRKYLAQYEASRPGTVHDTELDKNALLKMLKT